MADKNETPDSITMTQVFKAKTAKQGLVFGVGMVSKVKDEHGVFRPFVDSQGDHITDDEMFTAAIKFMRGQRTLKAMHDGEAIGEVLLAWPLTEEMAKLYNLTMDQTMWMVAVQPSDPADVDRFITGFAP